MTVGHNASDRPAKICNERGTVSPASQALALRRQSHLQPDEGRERHGQDGDLAAERRAIENLRRNRGELQCSGDEDDGEPEPGRPKHGTAERRDRHASADAEQPQRDDHDGADLQRECDEVQRLEDLLAVGRDDPALAHEQLRQR